MRVSLQYLERYSAETGFQTSVLEKVICLGTLSAEVARHPFSPFFATVTMAGRRSLSDSQ